MLNKVGLACNMPLTTTSLPPLQTKNSLILGYLTPRLTENAAMPYLAILMRAPVRSSLRIDRHFKNHFYISVIPWLIDS